MKKTLIITGIALFAVCFLVAAREVSSRGVCATEELETCIDRTAVCALDEDGNQAADLGACHMTLCTCLDSIGCEARLEEANCR